MIGALSKLVDAERRRRAGRQGVKRRVRRRRWRAARGGFSAFSALSSPEYSTTGSLFLQHHASSEITTSRAVFCDGISYMMSSIALFEDGAQAAGAALRASASRGDGLQRALGELQLHAVHLEAASGTA